MYSNETTRISSDGPTIYDLSSVLCRRWRWLLVALGITVGAATAYVLIKEPIFRANVKLKIGQVGGAGLFENPDVMAARLISSYGKVVADGVERGYPFLAEAVVDRNAAGVVSLTAEGRQPKEAVVLLRSVVTEVQRQHDEVFSKSLKALEERITEVDEQRRVLKRQRDESFLLFQSLKNKDSTQAALIAIELGKYVQAIAGLEAERPRLIQTVSPPETQPTLIFGEVVAPTRPYSPEKFLIILSAVAVGLMAGALAIFVAEFAPRRDASKA